LSESEVEEKKKPVKLEDVAEETGEAIGKGLKKVWSVTKGFGKGLVDTLEKSEEQKEHQPLTCPYCCASLPPHSNYCASCGKKL
jgi:hypothetical protein